MESKKMLPDAKSLLYQQPRWQTVYSAWAEHLPAAFWLVESLRPRRFVELGSHAGDSYCSFVQAMQALQLDKQGASAMAVDTWQGDAHSKAYGEDIYAQLAAHHDPLYGHFSKLNKKLFDDALADVEDGSVDLLHIDGLHTYEAVKHDFDTWLPKLSARGVVLFHDVSERQEDFGVWQLWDALKLQFPHLLLPHGHGLGILATGTDHPTDFKKFLSEAGDHELQKSQQDWIAFLQQIGQSCEQKRLCLIAQKDTARVQRDHDNLADAHRALDNRYHTLEAHYQQSQTLVQAMEQSASWKLTAPLRKLKAGLPSS